MGVYSDRLKNRGLRHGSGQNRGVLGTGQARKKGVLGTGQVKKGGSLLRHIPVLGIYVSAPPPGLFSPYKSIIGVSVKKAPENRNFNEGNNE